MRKTQFMSVKELKRALENLDDDTEVQFAQPNGMRWDIRKNPQVQCREGSTCDKQIVLEALF